MPRCWEPERLDTSCWDVSSRAPGGAGYFSLGFQAVALALRAAPSLWRAFGSSGSFFTSLRHVGSSVTVHVVLHTLFFLVHNLFQTKEKTRKASASVSVCYATTGKQPAKRQKAASCNIAHFPLYFSWCITELELSLDGSAAWNSQKHYFNIG